VGAISLDGVFPLAASFDTVGPMARSAADCALAYAVLTGTAVPEPRLRGVRVGVLTHPPDVTGGAALGARDPRADGIAARLRRLGADVREAALPVPPADTWPVFYADAAVAHAATFPSRADDYGPTIRAKLAMAQAVDLGAVRQARLALEAWRAAAAQAPDVDVVASPALGHVELPWAGVDELEIRLSFSAYTRAFSYLGWPAVALGGLQLAARDAPTLMAAALAVERT
jgi:Asp-tRNA(Asn)/Glu-tRNA(Gln) amidotransferase A subunit family amidase